MEMFLENNTGIVRPRSTALPGVPIARHRARGRLRADRSRSRELERLATARQRYANLVFTGRSPLTRRHGLSSPCAAAAVRRVCRSDLDLLERSQPHALERILPTGAAQLIINLKEDETRLYDTAARININARSSPEQYFPGPTRAFRSLIRPEQ